MRQHIAYKNDNSGGVMEGVSGGGGDIFFKVSS